jgi:hypothetical protein
MSTTDAVTAKVIANGPKATTTKPKPPRATASEKFSANDTSLRTGAKKDATKAKPAAKPPRFDPNISAAVAYARTELHSHKPGLDGRRAPASSAGDHIAVRAHIASVIEGPVTSEKVLALVGLSFPKLCEVAKFSPGTADDLKKLKGLGAAFAKDRNASWRQGRWLAGVVASYVRELRAAEADAKKAAK